MASTNHTESINLLLTGSDSCSDIPDFSAPKRKVRVKRKSRQNATIQRKRSFGVKHKASSICNSSCSTTISISLFMTVVAILMVLVWFIVQLRFQLDQLSTKFSTVEARNRATPGELHMIRTQLSALQKNFTLIEQNFKKFTDDASKMDKKISELQTTSNNIKSSIAAAPVIKNLPDDLHELSKNVASIGSKITNVEDKMEKLKTQHSDFDQKHKSFTSTIKQIQDDLAHVKTPNITMKPAEATSPTVDSSAINQVHQNMKRLEQEFDSFNSSVNDELESIEAKTSALERMISASSTDNQTLNDSQLNQLIHKSVNETVKNFLTVNVIGMLPQSSVNISLPDIMGDMNQLMALYIQLLSKFNQNSKSLIQDAESKLIIELLLNKIVDAPYSALSNKIQNISIEVAGLKLAVVDLKTNETNLSNRVDFLRSNQVTPSPATTLKVKESSLKTPSSTSPSSQGFNKNKELNSSTLSSSIISSSEKISKK